MPQPPAPAPPDGPAADDPATEAASALPLHFRRNALSNYALQAVTFLVTLLTVPLLAGHLGHTRYGVWALAWSVVTLLELLELGFGGTAVMTIGRQVAADDIGGVSRTVSTLLAVLSALGLVAFGVGATAAVAVPGALHLHGALASQARWLLLLLTFDMAVSIPLDTFGGSLIARQRYDLLNATLVTVLVAQAAGWAAVVATGGGLVELGVVTVALSLAGQVTRVVLARRTLPGLRVGFRHVDRSMLRSLTRLSAWNAVRQILSGFLNQLNVQVFSFVRGPAGGGLLSVGEQLAGIGGNLAGPMSDLYFPHGADLSARGDGGRIVQAAVDGSRMTTGITFPLCLVVVIAGRSLLHIWVGHGFETVAPAAALLAGAVALDSVAAVPRNLVSGGGRPQLPAVALVVRAAVDIPLTVVLGIHLGTSGVGLASLVAAAVYLAVLLPGICRRLRLSLPAFLGRLAAAHLPPLAVASALGYAIDRAGARDLVAASGRAQGLAVAAGWALAIVGSYWLVFFWTGLRADERRGLLRLATRRTTR